MHERDAQRLSECLQRADVLPLGAAALAGTTFPIDREFVARELGFARVSENSMDTVADRDRFRHRKRFCAFDHRHSPFALGRKS